MRTTAAAVVRALGVTEGDEIDPKEFASLVDELEPDCARERALRVLGYRDRSTRELEKRLVDDGYPTGIARELTVRLTTLGLLDDERFAHSWARTRAAAGFGSARIGRELKDKGLPPATIDAALAAAFEEADEVERARAVLGNRTPASRSEREKLVQKLVRRGFSFGVALKAVPGVEEGGEPDF